MKNFIPNFYSKNIRQYAEKTTRKTKNFNPNNKNFTVNQFFSANHKNFTQNIETFTHN